MQRGKDILAASILVQQKDTFFPAGEEKNTTAFSPPTHPRSLNPASPIPAGIHEHPAFSHRLSSSFSFLLSLESK